mgnify:CR=1 FL=1
MLDPLLSWLDEQQAVMAQQVRAWSQINSGTENLAGLAQMRTLISECFAPLGTRIEEIPGQVVVQPSNDGSERQVPVGASLRISKVRPDTPKIILHGHMDTVFPVDHPFQSLTELDEVRLQGPGVTDMKGGILVMLYGLHAFEQCPLAQELSWEVFLNSDEETGSRGSMPALLECAQGAKIGLGYEPCMPHGALAGARKGSANFYLAVTGKSAHAGREFHLGRNALAALCEFMHELHQLNQQRNTITLNIGQAHCPGPLNVVPVSAVGGFNIRIQSPDDQQWFQTLLDERVQCFNQQDGLSIKLYGGFTRPAKPLDDTTKTLCTLIQSCGARLGLELEFEATGGCCDGNNLAAAGVPTIDTLGVRGANIHTADEFIWLESLSERAKLTYLLLCELVRHPTLLR